MKQKLSMVAIIYIMGKYASAVYVDVSWVGEVGMGMCRGFLQVDQVERIQQHPTVKTVSIKRERKETKWMGRVWLPNMCICT